MDVDLLISLVEVRPVLWDKTSNIYKDRIETKNAWKEVCMELNSDFSNYDDEQKNNFGKEVVKRWVNIRDAFNKSTKKEKSLNKSGAGASVIKKYVYAEQLKFLSKVFCPRSTEDSLSINSGNEDTEPTVSENDNRNESGQFKIPPRKQLGSRKRKMDEVDMRMLKALEEPEDRHISFFKGIVPTLHTFTEDETVNFQMGVLQLLTNIKQRRFQTQNPYMDFNTNINYNRCIPTQKNMQNYDLQLPINQSGSSSIRFQTTENRPTHTDVHHQYNHIDDNPSSVDSNTDESFLDLDFS
ncbi:unnamed protein product [Macrosiphum euphorbiae]|uniref:MADF domain-containing protein n=1 Tax=Macrosiphum euphorbiae TaxID=13131 RepID=A0AAV0XVA1_9HEMI|nr:unnamed protein product [Macrosiphum euphorbiae]